MLVSVPKDFDQTGKCEGKDVGFSGSDRESEELKLKKAKEQQKYESEKQKLKPKLSAQKEEFLGNAVDREGEETEKGGQKEEMEQASVKTMEKLSSTESKGVLPEQELVEERGSISLKRSLQNRKPPYDNQLTFRKCSSLPAMEDKKPETRSPKKQATYKPRIE